MNEDEHHNAKHEKNMDSVSTLIVGQNIDQATKFQSNSWIINWGLEKNCHKR